MPIGAPVAYVHMEPPAQPERAAPSIGHADLVRASFESMTPTVEAMQRAQAERAPTEKQDPVAILKQQLSFREELEKTVARNALPAHHEEEDAADEGRKRRRG